MSRRIPWALCVTMLTAAVLWCCNLGLWTSPWAAVAIGAAQIAYQRITKLPTKRLQRLCDGMTYLFCRSFCLP